MAQNKLNKLELTWIGKYDEDKQPIEPRILIEDSQYSYGEVERGVLPNGKPWNGNMLIHGDNLLALKAFEQEYAGCVKSMLLGRCEFDRNDYSLNIVSLPEVEEEEEF